MKWDLENGKAMKGTASRRVLEIIAGSRARGLAMKLRTVSTDNRKKAFHVRGGGRRLSFPFANADPPPSAQDPVVSVFVDPELGGDGFTYQLASGLSGTVHVEQILEYNQDPAHLRDLLLYQLTLEAQRLVAASPLSKRAIIRRLGTSPSQLYRILDQTNYRKTVDQILRLLGVVGGDVQVTVRARTA